MKKLLWVLGGALVLGGCAGTAPVRFHSLYAPQPALHGDAAGMTSAGGLPVHPGADGAAPASTGHAYPMRVAVVVQVPERLNRSNIVLRGAPPDDGAGRTASVAGVGGTAASSSDTALQVLEGARWEAVFGDALQDALAAHLAQAMMPAPSASFRLDLKVYRFDAALSGPVDVLLDWTLQRRDLPARTDEGNGQAVPRALSCRYTARPAVAGGDVGAAVRAMQQVVGQLAVDVAQGARSWLQDGKPRCSGAGQASLAGWLGVGGQHGG